MSLRLPSTFVGLLICGGSEITAYVPGRGIQETVHYQDDSPIWKLRYVSAYVYKKIFTM